MKLCSDSKCECLDDKCEETKDFLSKIDNEVKEKTNKHKWFEDKYQFTSYNCIRIKPIKRMVEDKIDPNRLINETEYLIDNFPNFYLFPRDNKYSIFHESFYIICINNMIADIDSLMACFKDRLEHLFDERNVLGYSAEIKTLDLIEKRIYIKDDDFKDDAWFRYWIKDDVINNIKEVLKELLSDLELLNKEW